MKLLLKRTRWWNGEAEGHGDIRVALGVVAELGRGLVAQRGERTVDAEGSLVLPGLINCHDHLDLNLLPHLGCPPYSDFYAWAEEIYRPEEPPIRDILRIRLRDRLRWGGYKNLIAGATTVAHHDRYHPLWFGARFPVRVLKRYAWSHSLGFAADPARDYGRSRGPYLIHAAEGINGRSSSEVDELGRLGLLGRRTVIVHALAVTESQQRCLESAGCSVVWCPSSNLQLYGRTAPVDRYLGRLRVGLGTDSTISGTPHLLDELRVAHHSGLASAMDLLRMVTTTAAEILGLEDGQGRIEQGACAAMNLIGRAKPFVIPKPSTIRWEFCRCGSADAAEGLPGVRRVGPRAVEKTVTHAGYSILPGLLRCQAYPGETSHNGVKVIGPAGKLPPGSVG